jgi:hypothetical protein
MMIGRVGRAATRTKPVTKVPTSAPAVPAAESPPTTDPVSAVEERRSLAAIGLTALRTAVGSTKAASASRTMAGGPPPATAGPSDVTTGTETRASAPPATIVGPSRIRGSTRSASRPPAALPMAMPASTVPMTPV